MKNSLRNFALGAALAVGSIAFAQQPFTVTQNFVAKYGADVIGVTPSAEVRTGAGINGKVYAVDKANHRIVAFDGTGMTVVREDLPVTYAQKTDKETGEPVFDEEGNPVMVVSGTVGTALGIDDAGNMLFTWGWPNATMSKHFYIAPADGSAIIDLGETAPYAGLAEGDFTPARTDNIGRIVGDMMSEEGAILYVATTGMYKAGGLHIANGAYVEDTFEYAGDAMTYAAEGQSIAVPYYNTIEEQLAADPIYNAYYLIPRNAPFQTFYNGEAETIARPAEVDGAFKYCSNPGGDVINYDGKIYFVQPCHDGDTAGGAYKPGFMIYDEEQNLLFQEKFEGLAASGGYGNGGALNVRKVDDFTYEIYVFQQNKADNTIIVASYKVAFPVVVETSAFTITTNYITKNGADVIGVTPSAEMRTGAGINGKVYAVDKANHRIVAFDGTGMTVVREDLPVTYAQKTDKETGEPVFDEEGNPVMVVSGTVGTALGIDDAGNMLFTWGWPNATMSKHFYIAPADGSAIIDLGETAPYAGLAEGDFTPARTDNIGRIVGDMMSEEGAILYVATTGMYKAGGLHIANGAYVEDTFEYAGDAMTYAAEGQSIAVPYYNTIEEQLAADPIYNAYYLIPRNAPFQTFYNGEAETIARPAEVDGAFKYCSNPGGDVINYDGKIYFVQPCHDGDTAGGAYKPGFMIYDEEQNLLFQEKFEGLAASGGYGNGGNINVRKVGENVFEIYVFQQNKADNTVIMAYYTLNMKEVVPPTPAEPGQIYLVGAPTGWAEPSEANAATYADWKLAETGAETGIYTGSFTIPANKAMFRFFSALTGWDAGASLGVAEIGDVEVAFDENNTYTGTIMAGKGNLNFTGWMGGTMNITVDLKANTVTINATPLFTAPELYVRGDFNNWEANEASLMTKMDMGGDIYMYTVTLPTLAGEFKLATADWTTSFGAEIDIKDNGWEQEVWENGKNMKFNVEDAQNIRITFILTPDYTQPSYITLTWSSAAADLEADQSAARYFNLQGIEVPAEQLTTGVYLKLQGTTATKVTVK